VVAAVNFLCLRFSTVWLILCGGLGGWLLRRPQKGKGGTDR